MGKRKVVTRRCGRDVIETWSDLASESSGVSEGRYDEELLACVALRPDGVDADAVIAALEVLLGSTADLSDVLFALRRLRREPFLLRDLGRDIVTATRRTEAGLWSTESYPAACCPCRRGYVWWHEGALHEVDVDLVDAEHAKPLEERPDAYSYRCLECGAEFVFHFDWLEGDPC